MNADGKVFDLCEILNGLTLHFAQFKQMCIPAGCDHLKNWRGIGIHKACDMAAGDRDVLDALISKGADDEYRENFKILLQSSNIRQCSIWNPVPLVYLINGNLTHPLESITSVDCILVQFVRKWKCFYHNCLMPHAILINFNGFFRCLVHVLNGTITQCICLQ